MILHWDKDGTPIEDVLTWARLVEDSEYRQIALDTVGKTQVSTIWTGLASPSLEEGPIGIFETRIARDGEYTYFRHSTLEEAQEYHTWQVTCLLLEQNNEKGTFPE